MDRSQRLSSDYLIDQVQLKIDAPVVWQSVAVWRTACVAVVEIALNTLSTAIRCL